LMPSNTKTAAKLTLSQPNKLKKLLVHAHLFYRPQH
jgi:hypothetical protein